jgi:uncharacterized damage-inducible protein DinB
VARSEAEHLIAQLTAVPAKFASALERLGEDAFQRAPAEGEWSALDVLQHVRASDYILSARIWNALVRADAVYPGIDEVRYLELLRRAALPPREVVQAFAVRRRELVGLLRDLSAEEWMTEITTDFGSGDVRERCASLLGHEQEHLGQLRAIVKAVG